MTNKAHTPKGKGKYLCPNRIIRPRRCQDCNKILGRGASVKAVRCSHCSQKVSGKNWEQRQRELVLAELGDNLIQEKLTLKRELRILTLRTKYLKQVLNDKVSFLSPTTSTRINKHFYFQVTTRVQKIHERLKEIDEELKL